MLYDTIIIGGSAAGTAAAIYASRRKLRVHMISENFGGEVALGGEYHNYPGIVETTGIELTQKFKEQLEVNDVIPELGVWVETIEKKGEGHFVITAKKGSESKTYESKTVIIATGVHPRELEVPGETEFKGKGVTYCTTCDGPLFRNKKVVTVGGGNSAMESALMLAEIASHVTLLNRSTVFKGENVLAEKVMQHPNIDVLYSVSTTAIVGSSVVEAVEYINTTTQEKSSIPTQGVFVHVGLIPNSALAPKEVEKNPLQEIIVDQQCHTSVSGIFAAGDVTNIPYKQAVIAAGQGAIASLAAVDYINKLS